jgi:hypothetical protein
LTVQTKANLATRAAQVRNETAAFANDENRVGGLIQDIVDTLFNGPSGLIPASAGAAAVNTAAIQAAIDTAHTAYVAGSGVMEVKLPEGTFTLGPSTLAETYWNDGVAVLASDGCISMRDGVTLRGCGVGKTILKSSSSSLDVVHIVDGNNQTIEDIEIDGGDTAASHVGHGIIQILSTNNNATIVKNLRIQNVYVHDVGSYGCGIQNGETDNIYLNNFRAYNTGADGVDIKNRATSQDSKGIFITNLYVEQYGRRLDDQTGLDVRGIATISNVFAIGVGRTGVQQTGIRFRPRAGASGQEWGRRSSLSGFYIRGANATYDNYGVYVLCPDVHVSGGTVEDCAYGVGIDGETPGPDIAYRTTITGVTVYNALTAGFHTSAGADYAAFVGCTSVTCTTNGFLFDSNAAKAEGCHDYGSPVSFRSNGNNCVFIGCGATRAAADAGSIAFRAGSGSTHTKFVGCTADTYEIGFRDDGTFSQFATCSSPSCTSKFQAAAGSIQSERLNGNAFTNDFVALASSADSKAGLEARGTSADVDIYFEPKGAGVLRFGTNTAKGAEAFTSYITIKDSGGVSRKLMVCS